MATRYVGEKDIRKDIDNPDRDEVLTAFQESCVKPTAEDIITWVQRYPRYADDIRDHAVIALDLVAREGATEAPIDEGCFNDAFSHALAGLRAGDAENAQSAANDATAIHDTPKGE